MATSGAYLAGIAAIGIGAALIAFRFPSKQEEEALLARYHDEDMRGGAGGGASGGGGAGARDVTAAVRAPAARR